MELYLIWLLLGIAFVVVEIVTAQLTTIWFAIGAFITTIVAYFIPDLTTQMLVFVGTSFLMLIMAFPLKKKLSHKKAEQTNVNSMIGKTVKALNDFDSISNEGRVLAESMDWAAKSEEVVKEGDTLVVIGIQGVKVIVKHSE